MTTHLVQRARRHAPSSSRAPSLGRLVPGAAGLLYAGVQLEGGILAAAHRGATAVPDDRLSFPFDGALATAASVSWGLSQVLFVVTLVAFARSGAVGASRAGRIGAWLAVLGGVAYVAAHAISAVFRDARVDEPAAVAAIGLFVLGTVLTAVGLISAGVAVLRAGRWTSWRRYAALAVGAWTLCMLPLQFTVLLPVTVVIYAATVAAFSVALLSDAAEAAG